MNTSLSKSDLTSVLDIIHTSLSCTDVLKFEKMLEKVKCLIPFSHARCGVGDMNELDKKGMTAFKLISHFPQAWEIRYAEKNYLFKDAVAIAAYQKTGLLYWEDCLAVTEEGTKNRLEAQKILDEASDIGLSDGWIYSFQGRRSSERSIISIDGDGGQKEERSQIILELIGPHIGQVLQRLIQGKRLIPELLTSREYEILSWTANGKTAWETSRILNISRRTVEFHMGNILIKLDAVNSQQAVAIGVHNGLIAF